MGTLFKNLLSENNGQIHASFQEAFHLLLNEWAESHLLPHTLNIVTQTPISIVNDTLVNGHLIWIRRNGMVDWNSGMEWSVNKLDGFKGFSPPYNDHL